MVKFTNTNQAEEEKHCLNSGYQREYSMFYEQAADGRQCLKNTERLAASIKIFKNGQQPDFLKGYDPKVWKNMMNWKETAVVAEFGYLHSKSTVNPGTRWKESNGPRKKWGQNAVY